MVRNIEGDLSAFWCKSKCCGALSPQNVGWSFNGTDVGYDTNNSIQFSPTTGQAIPISLKNSGSCE